MKYIVTLFWFVVACLVALFTTMNSFSVNLHQPLGSMKVYFPLLLLITLVVGSFSWFLCRCSLGVSFACSTLQYEGRIKACPKRIR